MRRSAHVLIAILVPGAAAYYAVRWALRKFAEWREEGDPRLARIARTYACQQEYSDTTDSRRDACASVR